MKWITNLFKRNRLPQNPALVVHDSVLQQDRHRTTRFITHALLVTFIATLLCLFGISVGLIAKFGKPADDGVYNGWFDLLKSSLVLLGSTLTTIIGYYFGQRESAAALQKAEAAETKAKQEEGKAVDLDARLKKAEETAENLNADLTATMSTASTAPPAATFDRNMAQKPKPRNP